MLFICLTRLSGQTECIVKISYEINKSNPPSYTFKTDYTGTESKYFWTFGDSTVSDNPRPTHVFKESKIYGITVKITDKDGKICYGKLTDKFEGSSTVVIGPPVTCGFDITAKPKADNPLVIQFNTVSGYTLKTWKWSFGDGQTSTIKEPLITYKTPGTYEVKCEVTTAEGCTVARAIKVVAGQAQTKAYFTFARVSETDSAQFKKVIFKNLSTGDIKELKWSFGDGLTSNDKSLQFIHEYKDFGEYKVCLTILDNSGSISEYCATVVLKKPVAACGFDITSKPKADNPLVIQFNTVSANTLKTWKWSFGDGQTSTIKEPLITYKMPGTYEVKCEVTTAEGCTVARAIKVVAGQAQTKAYFTFARVSETDSAQFKKVIFKNLSTGDIKELKWSFGDGLTSNDKSLQFIHEYKDFGEYKVCLTILDNSGSISEYCATVVLKKPVAACGFDITSKPKADNPLVIQFNTVSANTLKTWKWSFGDGQTSTIKEPLITYKVPGTYEVKCEVTTAEGCTTTRAIKVEIKATLPTCGGAVVLTLFDPTPEFCNGKAIVKLVDEANNEYSNVGYFWSTGKTGNVADSLCYNRPYTVTAMVDGVCQKTTSFMFQSKAVWKVTTLADGKTGFTVINPNKNLVYKWDLGDGTVTYGPTFDYVYMQDGTYTVKLFVTGDGTSAEYSQELNINKSSTSAREINIRQFEVFPNPANDFVKIDLGTQITGPIQIEAINLFGQKLLNQQIMSEGHSLITLDINQLSPGIYVLRVSSDNQILQSQRFMKKD